CEAAHRQGFPRGAAGYRARCAHRRQSGRWHSGQEITLARERAHDPPPRPTNWRCDVAKESSQKFIARNRAPRVQIEYDLETYGSQKKIQLPFVMGVLSDLSGKPAEALPPVADRKFLEIDVDNFDARLKAMKPRVAFQV